MKAGAVVPAAGRGSRFGSDRNKIWASIGGRPVLEWTLQALDAHPRVASIVVAAAMDEVDAVRDACARHGKVHAVVRGGASRMDSVRYGLAALPPDVTLVLVHDAARPAISEHLISRVVETAQRVGAAVPGLPVADTVKRVEESGRIVATVDRRGLWTVQTPQAARRDWLEKAYAEVGTSDDVITDEAGLLEAAGLPVHVVAGEPDNIKITTPEDLERAREILRRREADNGDSVRTGFGYDIHRTAVGRELCLGGVKIPHKLGLLGHSDADVVLHAVCDAILGAIGEGDIGQLFPDTDPANKDRPSRDFVAEAARRARASGWIVSWLDITLLADEPRIGPYRQAMREAIAAAAGVETRCVSLKATTSEGLGFAGRKEGMACWAVATLVRRTVPSATIQER